MFLGDWDKAMQYRCENCNYDISMLKIVKTHSHQFACECGQRINCDVCGKKMNRWKSHGTLRHSQCDQNKYYGIEDEIKTK